METKAMDQTVFTDTGIPKNVIDAVLRMGSNRHNSIYRIVYDFMVPQPAEKHTSFLKKEYGSGGIGLIIDGIHYAVWFDASGITVAVGNSARKCSSWRKHLSWEEASAHIQDLLNRGEYVTEAELCLAKLYVLSEIAQRLADISSDMQKEARSFLFEGETLPYGYPVRKDRIKEMISKADYRSALYKRFQKIHAYYKRDRSVMRGWSHDLDSLSEMLYKSTLPNTLFFAVPGFEVEDVPVFITEDEIDAFLASRYTIWKLDIYSFFLRKKDNKDRAAFLKDKYGTGGCSHALSGADNSCANYNGKGLELKRDNLCSVKLNWNQVTKRIAKMIEEEHYLSKKDREEMDLFEKRKVTEIAINFYYHLPLTLESPFEDDFPYDNTRDKLPEKLKDPAQMDSLIKEMETALSQVPEDYRGNEERRTSLERIKQYASGEYTWFPEEEKIPMEESMGFDTGDDKFHAEKAEQMTIFDFLS